MRILCVTGACNKNNWLWPLLRWRWEVINDVAFTREQWVRSVSKRGDFLSFHWSFLQWRHCLRNWWFTDTHDWKIFFFFGRIRYCRLWLSLRSIIFFFIIIFYKKRIEKPSNINHPQHSSSNKSRSSKKRKKRRPVHQTPTVAKKQKKEQIEKKYWRKESRINPVGRIEAVRQWVFWKQPRTQSYKERKQWSRQVESRERRVWRSSIRRSRRRPNKE